MRSPEFPRQYPRQYLDSENFYDQTPFKEALDRAYDVLDPEHTNPLLNLGGLRRVLTLTARDPSRLHKNLDPHASEDQVTGWMIAGHQMLPSKFISAAKLPARASELRQAVKALGEQLQYVPGWIEYINKYLDPKNYTTDGTPRTRFKKYSSAVSYLYFAEMKRRRFVLLELGGLDEIIKGFKDDEN